MLCPKCGGQNLHIVDSRPRETTQFRRRACADCGHRFNTLEIPADEYDKLQRKEDKP